MQQYQECLHICLELHYRNIMAYQIDSQTNDLVITGWEVGISNSPYQTQQNTALVAQGVSDMKNVDIITVPGEASVAMGVQTMQTQGAITNVTFTADPATDTITYNGVIPVENNTAITVTNSGGALPGGLSANTSYFIANKTATTFQLVNSSVSIQLLVVGGGGGAGDTGFNGLGGSGGAGGVLYNPNTFVSVGAFPIIVGAGGIGSTGTGTGSTGGTSSFLSFTMAGGGGGGDSSGGTNGANAIGGGSGGGAGTNGVGGTATGGGFNGGNGTNTTGSGGGGAGGNATSSGVGTTIGGIGVSNSITGSPVTYGIGGTWTANGAVGGANTGNGANAGTHTFDSSHAGGSGVVIVSYVTGSITATGGTITTSGGRTIHKFTTSGTFTVSAISYLDITSAGTGTQTFSTIQMGTPKYYTSWMNNLASTNYIYYFLQDSNGRVWVYDSSVLNGSLKWIYMNSAVVNENILNSANGIIAYKSYLFFFTANGINVMSIVDQSTSFVTLAHLINRSSWFFNWQNLSIVANTNISHQALVSQLNQLLICNGNGLAIVFEPPLSLSAQFVDSFNLANTHTVADGVTTSGSSLISSVTPFFQATDVGAVIVGTGIPTGTTIASIQDSTHATLLINTASASNTGLTFTITSAFNFNPQILILPESDQAICLTELGASCLIGGINNIIYPWDETNVSYDAIIRLAENYIAQMVTVNTTTYIFTGNRGRIYVTNGSNAQLFAKMSDHLSGTVNPIYTWYGVTFNRNQIYFGLSVTDNMGNALNLYGGMWALDTDTKALRMLNQSSYGTYTGYVSALISYNGDSIGSTQINNGYGMFTGWYNGTIGGVDKGIATPYTGGQAYVETDIIPVGQFLTKKTFSNIEFKLATPLVAGESVTLNYRTNITEAYTLITLTGGGATGDLSGYGAANFQNVQWIQIRPYLTSTASSPSYTRLKELRLR